MHLAYAIHPVRHIFAAWLFIVFSTLAWGEFPAPRIIAPEALPPTASTAPKVVPLVEPKPLAATALSSTHWSYEEHGGAAHWGDLDPAYVACKLGRNQSPIDIHSAAVKLNKKLPALKFAYTDGAGEVVNNGHTIQVNLAQGGTVTIQGETYTLLQFHFHHPSEEKIDGKSFPLVAHLVHKSSSGQLAVIAVLFNHGRENAVLKPIFAHLPAAAGDKTALADTFNVARMLPAEHAYFSFTGSLTTPPCSENVRWQVLKTPLELSAKQLNQFIRLYPMNARPVQPLNGRVVQLSP